VNNPVDLNLVTSPALRSLAFFLGEKFPGKGGAAAACFFQVLTNLLGITIPRGRTSSLSGNVVVMAIAVSVGFVGSVGTVGTVGEEGADATVGTTGEV
jgi:hypothetical protein